MSTLKTRRWPLFALAGLFFVTGVVVLDGPVAGVICFAAAMTFIGACIRALATEDSETVKRVEFTGLIGGF